MSATISVRDVSENLSTTIGILIDFLPLFYYKEHAEPIRNGDSMGQLVMLCKHASGTTIGKRGYHGPF